MTALQNILDHYRSQLQSEREKGNYFEELIRTYFRYEASNADLYDAVWLFGLGKGNRHPGAPLT